MSLENESPLDPGLLHRDPDYVIERVRFNSDGLVPAIAQQWDTGTVLMLAWMDRGALEQTLRTRKGTYFSRSRGKRWVKGETSGHGQDVRALHLDCDGDTILILVDQDGPACHTGARSCFEVEADPAPREL